MSRDDPVAAHPLLIAAGGNEIVCSRQLTATQHSRSVTDLLAVNLDNILIHLCSERADVKGIESTRNLSAKAWFRRLSSTLDEWSSETVGLNRSRPENAPRYWSRAEKLPSWV